MEKENTNEDKNLQEGQSSILQLISRIFAGVGGGLLGTSISLLVIVGLVFSQEANNSIFESSKEFSGATLLIVIFIASFASNLSALFFLTLVDTEKYKFRKHIIKGGFFANISLFIFALPFYIFTNDQELLLSIAGIHLFLSASNSALFAEIFSGIRYVISGVVGVAIAQMIMIFIYISLGAPSSDTIAMVLFLPFIWFLLPLFIFLMERFYLLFSQK
jgi:hypothetical protein